jgi:hypothetical protein
MKLLLFALLFVSVQTWSAPFLVTDPSTDATADTCAWQEGTVVTRTPLVAAACHSDLAAVTTGAHSITVWFESSVWGTQSAAVPFAFTRPVGGGVGPGHPGISKQ